MKSVAKYNKCGRCGGVYPDTLEYFTAQRPNSKHTSSYCVYCQATDRDRMQISNMRFNEKERQRKALKKQKSFIAYMKRYAREDSGVVYFIQCRNLIKIGRATNLRTRLKSHRKEFSKHKLHLLGVVPGGDITERKLHNQFQHLRRYRNEWFKAAPELIDWILANARLV